MVSGGVTITSGCWEEGKTSGGHFDVTTENLGGERGGLNVSTWKPGNISNAFSGVP